MTRIPDLLRASCIYACISASSFGLFYYYDQAFNDGSYNIAVHEV